MVTSMVRKERILYLKDIQLRKIMNDEKQSETKKNLCGHLQLNGVCEEPFLVYDEQMADVVGGIFFVDDLF